MHKKDIVLFTGVQRFCSVVRNLGYSTAVLQGPGEDLAGRGDVDYPIPYHPDKLDRLESTIARLPFRDRIAAAFNRRELRVRELARINRVLGLEGVTIEQAEIVTDKYILHRTLHASCPDLCAPFTLIRSPRDAVPDLPVVLKPRNFFKSQLISLCTAPKQIKDNVDRFNAAREEAYRRHGVVLKEGLLAEGYLQGKECALDSLVDAHGKVHHALFTELISGWEVGWDDFHVFARISPGALSAEERREVEHAAERAASALDLKNTATHIDFIVTDNGPKILEIGARIGGYRSEMGELSFGISLDRAYLEMLLGNRPDLRPEFTRHTAVLEFFPATAGKFKDIQGLEHITESASYYRHKVRFHPGDEVGLTKHGFRCVLFVILVHRNESVLRKDIRTLQQAVRVRVET